jgi:hypothetical protein
MSATEPASGDQMDAQRILAIARSETHPPGWRVWPLRRDRVRRQALEMGGAAALGFVLLVPLFLATVPSNFQHGIGLAVMTILLLGLFGTLAFGALSLLIGDLLRLARADAYLLVLTPTDYLKVEPGRTTHIPMTSVGYVTLKGVNVAAGPSDAAARDNAALTFSSLTPIGALGRFAPFGRQRTPRRHRPPTLAFVDLRADRQVVVAMDDSFEDLLTLKEILREYAASAARP